MSEDVKNTRRIENLTNKGKGRPRGVENKVTRDVRELAQRLFDAAYWTRTKKQLGAGKLHPAIHAKLLAYAYGSRRRPCGSRARSASARSAACSSGSQRTCCRP
jgi:hypothetical protein